MYIALNSKKQRIHISESIDGDKYYCPVCNEEVIKRKGTINAHHYAHKNNSQCLEKDGWHYDMSDWHYDWQNQFPVENQEVVFKSDNKIHRADVFINDTVLEFQHSPITEEEFNDRNEFYNNLGYKVIWIFDALEKELHHYRNYRDDDINCSWSHPIKFLGNVNYHNPKLDVYLQIGEAIWYRQPDYKKLKDYKELAIDGNVIKISKLDDGIKEFSSDDYYSDFELIDKFIPFESRKGENYFYKKITNIHRLTDEIYNYDIEDFYGFYGYCPLDNDEFYNHKECHGCGYLDSNCMRCNYRFRNLKKDRVSEIIDVKYDRDGRVIYVKLKFDNDIKEYNLEKLPTYTKTLLEFAEKKNNVKVARFINIKTGKIIQMTGYGLRMLIKTKKCIGKLCSDNLIQKASSQEFEIYNWDKPIWLLKWFIEND